MLFHQNINEEPEFHLGTENKKESWEKLGHMEKKRKNINGIFIVDEDIG